VVFVQVIDPVGAGFVDSLARPGGNATRFMLFEFSLSEKWLELLKEAAPGITRVAVVRDPAIAAGTGQFGAIQSVASSFGVEVDADRRARRSRDRAWYRRICAWVKRWSHCDSEPISNSTLQTDR